MSNEVSTTPGILPVVKDDLPTTSRGPFSQRGSAGPLIVLTPVVVSEVDSQRDNPHGSGVSLDQKSFGNVPNAVHDTVTDILAN